MLPFLPPSHTQLKTTYNLLKQYYTQTKKDSTTNAALPTTNKVCHALPKIHVLPSTLYIRITHNLAHTPTDILYSARVVNPTLWKHVHPFTQRKTLRSSTHCSLVEPGHAIDRDRFGTQKQVAEDEGGE